MSSRNLRISLFVLVILLLVGVSYCGSKVRQPVDWSETYMNKDKIPYGTYILYDLLDDIFMEGSIYPIRHTISNEFNDYYDYYDEYEEDTDSISYITSGVYLFVNKTFTASKSEVGLILDFASVGNDVFIAAEKISPNLLDTLGLKTDYEYVKIDGAKYRLSDVPKRVYSVGGTYAYTIAPDSLCKLDVRVLGYLEKPEQANFIQINYGEGHIYIHTTPKAFSNIELLKLNQYDYAFRCLSYIPKISYVIWDEYQKQGAPGERSIFRVIWADRNLKTAFLILLAGIIVFVIFRSKRIQRIIPIVRPPRNSSLEFLGTLSNLYQKQEDYQTIANKRMAFLLDQIRRKYYLSTEILDDEFMNNLNLKSGVDIELVKDLFVKYKDVRDEMGEVSNAQFLRYNEALEKFYKQSNIRK